VNTRIISWRTAGSTALVLSLVISGCSGQNGSGQGAAQPGDDEIGDPTEAAPPKTLFSPTEIASFFSYNAPLGVNDADLGPDWETKGKILWAVTYASPNDTFAPVTLILFKGHYREKPLTIYEKDLLLHSGGYKDLTYKNGRTGYAMRAAGDGDALETASIPSPRGRYELLVLIDVKREGPEEGPGTEAYRALLMDYTVKLLESVAMQMDAAWVRKR
jgi:hypothetical protein